MLNAENELKKWAPVLDHSDAPPITDKYKKAVTAKLLENTEIALRQESAQASFMTENSQNTGSIASPDPVLISLVRRAMPNLIAYDVAGVQPMSGPTGLIFAMKPRYGAAAGAARADITTSSTEAFKVSLIRTSPVLAHTLTRWEIRLGRAIRLVLVLLLLL